MDDYTRSTFRRSALSERSRLRSKGKGEWGGVGEKITVHIFRTISYIQVSSIVSSLYARFRYVYCSKLADRDHVCVCVYVHTMCLVFSYCDARERGSRRVHARRGGARLSRGLRPCRKRCTMGAQSISVTKRVKNILTSLKRRLHGFARGAARRDAIFSRLIACVPAFCFASCNLFVFARQ